MWVAKIRFSEKGTLIGTKAQKHSVNLFAFPLSYYYGRKWIVVSIAGTVFGKEKDKKKFVRELKKEKRVVNFELNEDFFIGIIKEPIYAKLIYNKDVIHLAPALISDKGYEIMTIGCFKREPLIKIANLFEKKRNGKLLLIQQKKIKSISVMRAHPDLTDKQKHAIDLAIKHSYYNSPRKTSVKKLAKLAGLSFSTFQVHLRKAEQKLIPYFFE